MRTGTVLIGSCWNGCALPHPGLSTFVGYFVRVPTYTPAHRKIYFEFAARGAKPKLKKREI